MKNILRDFLAEGEALFEIMFVDFFPAYNKKSKNNDGILPIYYTKWLCLKGLLNFEIEEALEVLIKNASFKEKLKSIRKIMGNELRPSHLTHEGFLFTRKYYNPSWKYLYFKDFGTLFPGFKTFEDIPDTQENYRMVEFLLDQRFVEWKAENQ